MSAVIDHVLPLDACTPDDRARVGGKAMGLGSLLREGLRVPPGFAVTTDAYRDSVIRPGIASEVARILDGAASTAQEHAASERIVALFAGAEMADEVSTAIALAYWRLGGGEDVPVAIRSSATAEDTAEASFAGQQETYLWIRGANDVVRAIRRCWGSLFTPQAIAYRRHFGVSNRDLAMAVVVQRMVDATAAGVMITLDPLTGDPSQVTIETSYGLGLAVVGGEVTPDRYAIDKVTWGIRARAIAEKPIAYRFDLELSTVAPIDVPVESRGLPAITDEEAVSLARLGRAVERAHGAPQDIEWAIGPGLDGPREVFLLQTRPETVWSRKPRTPIADPNEDILSRMLKSMSVPMRLRETPRSDGGSAITGDPAP